MTSGTSGIEQHLRLGTHRTLTRTALAVLPSTVSNASTSPRPFKLRGISKLI
jgi:hypothetical protein